MFSYCSNNPVMLVDPSGRYPGDGFDPLEHILPQLLKYAIDWFSNTSEDEKDAEGNLSVGAKIKRTLCSIGNNFAFSVGVGLGHYLGLFAADYVSIDAGIHYDLFRVNIADGQLWMGQYMHEGVDGTVLYISGGNGREAIKEYGSSTWEYRTTESSIVAPSFGGSAYFIAGGTFMIGYDVFSFLVEVCDIWWGE